MYVLRTCCILGRLAGALLMKQVGFSFYSSHDSLIILLKLSIFNFLLSLNNYNSIQIVCFYGEDLAIKLVSKLFVLMYK